MTDDPDSAAATDAFEVQRAYLLGVAYRILGSRVDAEDVVQEAWLRWSRIDRDAIDDPRAYLVTTTTRLAIDRLRRVRVRRESFTGTWLPEPIATADDPAELAELAESVAMGLLRVLETLSPLERAVFVLREAFGYDYAQIAAIIDRREPAVRQLARRARDHVAARRPRYTTDPETHRRVTEGFLAATTSGDVAGLVGALAPDVVLIADGGGRVRAPRLPVEGVERVIRFLAAVAGRSTPDQRTEIVELNGWPNIIVRAGGRVVAALVLEIDGTRVRTIYLVGDPDKLDALSAGGHLRPGPTS